MTYSRERGGGEAGSASGPGLLLRRIAARLGRRVGRVPSSGTVVSPCPEPPVVDDLADKAHDDASFEAHVDQALQIASQLPTLRVVSLNDSHSAARM
jgi:hypothetical protein